MSVIGDIVDAIIVVIGTAVPGITTEKENFSVSALKSEDLPHVGVIATLFESELIDFRQELHTWTVALTLVQDGGTRESLELKIEAIRNEIFADTTLGAKVDRAHMLSAVAHSQADASRLQGQIDVIATKVKN